MRGNTPLDPRTPISFVFLRPLTGAIMIEEVVERFGTFVKPVIVYLSSGRKRRVSPRFSVFCERLFSGWACAPVSSWGCPRVGRGPSGTGKVKNRGFKSWGNRGFGQWGLEVPGAVPAGGRKRTLLSVRLRAGMWARIPGPADREGLVPATCGLDGEICKGAEVGSYLDRSTISPGLC